MIKNKNIICISFTTWKGQYTKSTVQLLSILARNNNVFFIEYPRTVKDMLMSILGKRKAPVMRMLGLSKRIVEVSTEFNSVVQHVIAPPMLPLNFIKNKHLYNFLNSINKSIYVWQVKKIHKKYDLTDPIVVSAYNPVFGLASLKKINQILDIYYCYDGMDHLRNHSETIKLENVYCKKVDGIICSSTFLKNQKINENKNTFLVKNGVDFTLFSKARKTNPHPKGRQKKVGYIGSLDYRFDIDLMESIIKLFPEIKFEFTGSVLRNEVIQRLMHLENVTFFSAIKACEVPKILATYDVGIIPYNYLEINKGIYPLKLNEFLAVGLPVVMTNFAPLDEFKGIVSISNNKNEFAKNLKNEIENDSIERIQKRIEYAQNNSWEKRAEKFDSILSELYTRKKSHSNDASKNQKYYKV